MPGLAVEALLFSLAVGALERRRARARGAAATIPTARLASLPAVTAGVVSHLLLDALNTYGVRPWLPFSGARNYGDLVAIVDPALWLIFGAAALLARPGRRRLVLGAAAAMLLLYLGGRAVARDRAWDRAERAITAAFRAAGSATVVPVAIVDHVPRPDWIDPRHWSVVAATADDLYRVEVRLGGQDGAPERFPRHLDDPRVAAAAVGPEGTAWRAFARLPLAAIRELPGGAARVDLMDGRYALRPGTGWSSFSIVVGAAKAPTPEPGR